MHLTDIPVLIVVFNRPQKFEAIIDAISQVKPAQIFVAADGPRESIESDYALCKETRKLVKKIDWPCTIKTKFSHINLGLSENMEQAIDWFFENNDMGIIFEDDCIPHPDFFRFAEQMLHRYKDDLRIMAISGNNFQDGKKRGDGSYFFSRYASIWGWATWKRAWKLYDKQLEHLEEFIDQNQIASIFSEKKQQTQWVKNFSHKYIDKRGRPRLTWATTWFFSVLYHRGFCIKPNINLVQNVGFGDDATHTKGSGKKHSIKTQSLGTIVHPEKIQIDADADNYVFKRNHQSTWWKKLYHFFAFRLDQVGLKKPIKKIAIQLFR